jgi:hypothetical protein
MTSRATQTVQDTLAESLRGAARAFAPGDQVAPCAVLWLDPERLWEPVVPALRATIPELFVLGSYAPADGSGPALWLRCVEARTVAEAPPAGTTPAFYLPGVSRERIKDLETITAGLAPLAEIQFRGIVWLHSNGKEWTPLAFLLSQQGGLGLDVPRDQATQDALLRALPKLLQERVEDLRARVLNAEFFNELIAPDAAGLILRWLHDPEGFAKRTSDSEWNAFCQQCKADYRLDPEKDGPLKAAHLLASRGHHWSLVWQRFAEAPAHYEGVVQWLRRAAPKSSNLFDTGEVWPSINDQQERELATALAALANKPLDEAARRLKELEQQHGVRRRYPWRALGLSPFAVALEPLARVAALVEKTPGGPTGEAFAELYVEQAWEVDAAALEVMAGCDTAEQHGPVLGALRAVYLPWLETTARHLQHLLAEAGGSPGRRHAASEAVAGIGVLFADGLRFDVAKRLTERLAQAGMDVSLDWDWAPLPTVTATAKPFCSPLAESFKSGDITDEFAPNLETGQRVTQDRFLQTLKADGWQVLGANETGDPAGFAWTEAGTLDRRGHTEGWKLAHAVAGDVRDLASRIVSLLNAGWSEVHVVTDHGWLLLPHGLPKVELKSFLAEHRWGRCAAIKPAVTTNLPEVTWHWNETVRVVVPPGVGCFRAGMEYSHGGVSLQEMVVPRLTVRAGGRPTGGARLVEARWTGARCRIVVEGAVAGLAVDVRSRIGDASTSFLAGGQPKAVGVDGAVTVFLEDDADIGKEATVVLLDDSQQVIDSLPTELGASP